MTHYCGQEEPKLVKGEKRKSDSFLQGFLLHFYLGCPDIWQTHQMALLIKPIDL